MVPLCINIPLDARKHFQHIASFFLGMMDGMKDKYIMGFERGDPVLVYAPAFYKEHRIGIFLGPCKDHDGAFRIILVNPEAPIKEVCANPQNGDTIEMLQQTQL
jgi:hypothetical protein